MTYIYPLSECTTHSLKLFFIRQLTNYGFQISSDSSLVKPVYVRGHLFEYVLCSQKKGHGLPLRRQADFPVTL